MNSNFIDMIRLRRQECVKYNEFEQKYNIDIGNPIIMVDDGIESFRPVSESNKDVFKQSYGYLGSSLFEIDIINNYLENNIKNIEDYTFIDIGSGKGKVILYNKISNKKYKKNIGIEIDQRLHKIAENNLANISSKYDIDNIFFINENVLEYTPISTPTIYYFFQPFTSDIYIEFLSKNKDILLSSKTLIVNIFPYSEGKEVDFDSIFIDFKKVYSQEYISIYSN